MATRRKPAYTPTTDEVERFMALFRGSDRSHGLWDPGTKEMLTVHETASPDHYRRHLAGVEGLGQVPVRTDATAQFGVIDIDVHGPGTQAGATVARVAAAVAKFEFPLVVCRSKSGGVHCYAFWSEPIPAGAVQDAMKQWAVKLGYPTVEIFPKQRKLGSGVGSWINLPYFAAPFTERYAMIGGKQATLELFLDTAESVRLTGPVLAPDRTADAPFDFVEAPPCLVQLYNEKCGTGERNKALFQAAVWLKRQHPADWQLQSENFNQQAFERPLEQVEIKKILGSVAKRDYSYRCNDEPCVSRCQRDLCKTKKFGIKSALDYFAPPVEKILKINTDPPRYVVKIFERDVTMDSRTLLTALMFKHRVFEITGKLLQVPTSPMVWDEFVMSLDKLTEQTDGGLGTSDVFITNFRQVAQDAITDKQEPEERKRRIYARDTGPAVVEVGGKQVMAFKFAHLEKRLKQQFSMHLTSSDLATLLRTAVDAHAKDISIDGRSERMWAADIESFAHEPKPPITVPKTDY